MRRFAVVAASIAKVLVVAAVVMGLGAVAAWGQRALAWVLEPEVEAAEWGQRASAAEEQQQRLCLRSLPPLCRWRRRS